jgi:hypothetical protein
VKKEKFLSNGQMGVARIPNGPRNERLKRILKGVKVTVGPEDDVQSPVEHAFGAEEENADELLDWPNCMRLAAKR